MAPAGTLSLLTTTILLLSASSPSSAAATPSSTATLLLQQPPLHHPTPAPSPSPSSASDLPEYKIYIVTLIPRGDGTDVAMDDDARRDWHTSLLPSVLTVDGRKRLVFSYDLVFQFQGFVAWLTDEEVEAMKVKPGFGLFYRSEDHEYEPDSF